MKKTQFVLLLAVLSALGLGLFAYKAFWLGHPLAPQSYVPVWNLQARLAFDAKGRAVEALLKLPESTSRFTVSDEQFIHPGYGFTVAKDDLGNRRLSWTKRQASGKQTLYYRATLVRVRAKPPKFTGPPPVAVNPGWQGPKLQAAQALLAELKAKSAGSKSLISLLLKDLQEQRERRDYYRILLEPKAKNRQKMALAVKLLNLAGIPAREVHGVLLSQHDRRTVPLSHWPEAWVDKKWTHFDPTTAQPDLSRDLLPWWRGPERLFSLAGGEKGKVTTSVSVGQLAARGAFTSLGRGWLSRISLQSLPVDTQQVYRVLLVVPLGALVLVFLRNFVGIKTFGTFMPVLIALSFRETRLITGLVMFALVIAAGMAVRLYLDRLKLLVVPRLAAVLTVVVMIMIALSLITNQMGLVAGLSVALFPMVILTMTIERMSIVWDERGPGEALKQAGGSLFCASVAYVCMSSDLMTHVLFVFPELLLVLLAVTMASGRYTGFRLLELKRFKALTREAK